MADGYNYPFFAPNQQAPQYQEPQEPVSNEPRLICDYCKKRILPGEECINGLYGIGGFGSKSGNPCVVLSKDIPEGAFDVHYVCFSWFLLENLPEIGDEIIAIRDEMLEDEEGTEEILCSNCEAVIEMD